MYYNATFTQLNNSGVTGNAHLTYNPNANTLNVKVHATGLEAGMAHAMHIHGRLTGPKSQTGTTVDSISPLPQSKFDSDGDGYVELKEAQPAYGAILVPLTTPPGGGALTGPFPTAPNGIINYNETFNLGDSGVYNTSMATGNPFHESQLFPLNDRELVIHGMSVPAGAGAGTPGEVDGTSGYKAVLPVASAEIVSAAVPEPGAIGMMGLGLAMIGGLAFTQKRRGKADRESR
jgi:hypothetical protein